MCEFCHQHGEGKRWYLLMENYSQELFAMDNRQEFMHDFFANFEEDMTANIKGMEKLQNAPRLVQKVMKSLIVRKYKKEYYGSERYCTPTPTRNVLLTANTATAAACAERRAPDRLSLSSREPASPSW